MKNTREVMGVASEPATAEQNDRKAEETREIIKNKFCNWCIGIVVSIFPLFAVPVVKLVGGKGIGTMFYTLFCDINIMYVGISFTITAMNDFLENHIRKKKKRGWVGASVLLLSVGMLIYISVVVLKEVGGCIDSSVVFWLNLTYFVVMLLMALSKYLKEFVEVR